MTLCLSGSSRLPVLFAYGIGDVNNDGIVAAVASATASVWSSSDVASQRRLFLACDCEYEHALMPIARAVSASDGMRSAGATVTACSINGWRTVSTDASSAAASPPMLPMFDPTAAAADAGPATNASAWSSSGIGDSDVIVFIGQKVCQIAISCFRWVFLVLHSCRH